MTAISFTNRRLFKMRRDGQVAAASREVNSGVSSSGIITSSTASDSSDKVAKAGDTMTGELIIPLVTAEQLDTDVINERTSGAGVTADGVLLKDNDVEADEIRSDTLSEKTSGAGVTADGVLLKDNDVEADEIRSDTLSEKTSGAGVTADGVLLKDNDVEATEVRTNIVSERTSGAGVTADGVLLKDYDVTATDVSATGAVKSNTVSERTSGSGVTVDGVLLKDNDVEADQVDTDLIESLTAAFVSGFTGTGFQLGADSEVDSLIVRGAMKVYELIINKIRATNGSLWVSDSAKALTDMAWNGSQYYFEVEEYSNTFVAGDIIKAQAFTGSEVYSNVLRVHSTSGDRVNCITEAGGTVPSDQRSTENMEFVRIGNVSTTNRQGSLYLTASDSNAPFLEVLDEMTSSTIGTSNRKVRLGRLDGLSFDGESIGGYGLWSDSAYLTGVINAIAGEIAAWTISGDSISAENAGGDMVLDGSDSSLTVKNSSGITKIRISPESIPSLADLASASSKSYTGSLADSYTDVSQVFSAAGTDDDTWWLHKLGATSSYLDLDTSQQDETYNIDGLTVGLPYATVITWDTALAYTIPTDDVDPSPDGVASYYELGGSYSQVITVKAYSNTDVLLATQTNSFTGKVADLADVTIFNKTITPTTESIYFTIRVQTNNGLYTEVELRYYEWNDPVWVPTGEVINTSQNLATTFNMQIESLVMTGTYNQVQIGENGLSHYSTGEKYFMINEDESRYLQTSGSWEHGDGDIILGKGNTTADAVRMMIRAGLSGTFSTSYDFEWNPLCINANYNGYAIAVLNSDNGSTYGRNGIQMRLGPTAHTAATDVIYLLAQDGNGTTEGSILNDSTSFRIYSASDENLKENIEEIDGADALVKLKALKPKSFTMKKNSHLKENPSQVGYIAQDMQKDFPKLVKKDEETGILMIGETGLIPFLHKAIQQQQEVIETLQGQVSDLTKRLEKLEKAK